MLRGMVFLLACTETMVVDDVEDELRTALQVYREGDDFGFYWFSNTPVPCEPEDLEDDPATQPDEEADAYTWWAAQVVTAFTREDGLNVAVVTGALEDGTYAAGWHLAEFGEDEAIAAWVRVTEAVLTEMADYWLVYEVEDYTSGLGIGDVEVADGTVRVDTDGPILEAEPELCTYPGMRYLLEQTLGGWTTQL